MFWGRSIAISLIDQRVKEKLNDACDRTDLGSGWRTVDYLEVNALLLMPDSVNDEELSKRVELGSERRLALNRLAAALPLRF